MRRQKYLRGLADLKTRYGLGSSRVAPHTAYMKITSLEIEKLRLSRVREDAMQRIADVDARFREIQREKTALLAAIGPSASARPAAANGERTRGVGLQLPASITIRY
jgi:hypothetical protein